MSEITLTKPRTAAVARAEVRALHAQPGRVGIALGYATAALLGTLVAATAGAQAAPSLPERHTPVTATPEATALEIVAPSAGVRGTPSSATTAGVTTADTTTRRPAAQDAPSQDAPSPVAGHADDAPSPLPLLTPDRRRADYTRETFGPGAFLGTIPGAALAQAFDTPKEWGRGSAGYARRYTSAFGSQVVRNTLLFGAGAAFHEDRRYTRLGEGGVGSRVGYAVLRTAFVPTTDGRPTLCRSCFVAAAGTGLATSAWYPSRSAGGVARRAAGFAAGELVGFATGNLLSEFGPDVLHALGRIIHRGPRE